MDEQKKPEHKILYMPLGISIGVALGVCFDNMPLWMCLGLSIGMCLGTAIDAANKGKDEK